MLTSLGTSCHKWLNCLFGNLGSFLLFQALTPIQNESDAWKHWCTYCDMAGYDVITYVPRGAEWHHSKLFLKFVSCTTILYQKCPNSNIDGKLWRRPNIMEICSVYQFMCPPGRQYNWKYICGYFRIPILWKISPYMMYQIMLNIRFVHRVVYVHPPFQT